MYDITRNTAKSAQNVWGCYPHASRELVGVTMMCVGSLLPQYTSAGLADKVSESSKGVKVTQRHREQTRWPRTSVGVEMTLTQGWSVALMAQTTQVLTLCKSTARGQVVGNATGLGCISVWWRAGVVSQGFDFSVSPL